MKLSEIHSQSQQPQKLKLSQITAGAQAPQTGTFAGLPQETAESIKQQIPTGGRGQGAVQARRERAANLERIRQENPYEAQLIEGLSGPETFAIGLGKGLQDVAQGVGRAIGVTTQEEAKTPQEYERLRSVRGGATGGEIAGQALPFVPAGLGIGNVASLPARVALSSGLGGTEGALISAGTGGEAGDILKGAAVGAAIGGGAEMALPVLNRAGRYVVKKLTGREIASAVTPEGALAPEVQQVLTDNGLDVGDLERIAREVPEAAADDVAGNARRQAAFEKLGITPTEAQRTRSASLFREQQDLYKTGDNPVRTAVEAQDEALARQVGTASEAARQGATTSDNAIDVVMSRSLRLDDEISQAYKAAKEIAPTAKNIRFDDASKQLRMLAPRNERSQGTVKAIADEMKNRGLVDENMKPIGRISVAQAEDLRQFANTLYDGANSQGRFVISQFKDALDNDVGRVIGDDIFGGARAAKAKFERDLRKAKINKFDQNQVSLVRDMLENKIAPEEMFNKVVKSTSRYKAADLENLKKYLTSGAEADVDSGMKAWNNIRGDALRHIQDVGFIGPETQSGYKSLTRAGLQRAFKDIGDAKMKVLFSDQERQFLKDLADVASLREPPPATFTGSGPTSVAIKELQKSIENIFGNVPWVGPMLKNQVEQKQTQAAVKRVLKLADDAALIEAERAKEAFLALRRSRIGETIGAAPVAAVAATQGEEPQ